MARNLSGTGFTNIRTLNGTGGLSGVLNELQNNSDNPQTNQSDSQSGVVEVVKASYNCPVLAPPVMSI